jgi:DnaA family protein
MTLLLEPAQMSPLQHALVPAGGMRQLPLDFEPVVPAGLEQFVPEGNEELLAWLMAWPDSAQPGTPAYLWGPAGCGKTHLLRGLAGQALALGWHVLWLDRQGFQSWDSAQPEAPTLVLMDDCESLDAPQQHWAFNLFIENAAATAQREAAGGQGGMSMAIVAAGRVPPVDLNVRDDLRTRLGWGLIFGVQALSEEGVRLVLTKEAKRRGVRLAEGVLPYLLTHFSRDLGFLMDLLERLDRFALAEQRLVTVPLLKQMLAQETE